MTKPEPTEYQISVAEEFTFRLTRAWRNNYAKWTLDEFTEEVDMREAKRIVAEMVEAGTLTRAQQ